MSLDEIIGDYIRNYRDAARAEMRFFEIQAQSVSGYPQGRAM
jgi:hypothetical protein